MRLLALTLLLLCFVSCRSHRLTQFFTNGELVSTTAVYEEIPFELQSGLIILEVMINERVRKFILDTGAPNVISTDLAEEINPKTILNGSVTDSQDQEQTLPFVKLDHIEVGDLTFNGFGAIVADWSSVPQLACLEVDGLLGANLMRKAIWQIDYQEKVIRIAGSLDQLGLSKDTIGFDFRPTRQGSPHFDLTVGEISLPGILVDLGSNKSIDLSKTSFKRLNERFSIQSIKGFGFGSAGLYGQVRDTSFLYLIPKFKIGDHSFPPQLAKASGDDSGALGNGFFKQYRTTFDWQRNRIYLEPTEVAPASSFESHGVRFSFQEEQLTVGYIYEGSPAAEANITIGQVVTKVDQYNFETGSQDTYCQFYLDGDRLKELETLEIEVVIEGQPTAMQLPKRVLIPR